MPCMYYKWHPPTCALSFGILTFISQSGIRCTANIYKFCSRPSSSPISVFFTSIIKYGPFHIKSVMARLSLFSHFKSINPFSRKSSRQKETTPSPTKLFQANNEEMRRVFSKFDANKDGKLSAEELGRVLRALGRNNSQAEVMGMVKVADTDNDGFIDFNEFMAVVGMGGGVKEVDMQSAFHVFDVDGDGKISGEELFQVLKRLGERSSLEECKRMVKGVDKDGDGKVDIQEFMVMMTNNMKMVH